MEGTSRGTVTEGSVTEGNDSAGVLIAGGVTAGSVTEGNGRATVLIAGTSRQGSHGGQRQNQRADCRDGHGGRVTEGNGKAGVVIAGVVTDGRGRVGNDKGREGSGRGTAGSDGDGPPTVGTLAVDSAKADDVPRAEDNTLEGTGTTDSAANPIEASAFEADFVATAAAGDVEVCGGRIGPVSEPDGLEGVAELTAVARDGAVCAATEDSTLVTRVDALDGLIPGAGLVDVLAGADVTGTGAGATAGTGAARVAGGRIDSAALAAPSASAAGERAVGDEVLVCVGDATGTVVSEPAELCPAANPSVTAGNELSKLAAADKGEVEVGAEETGCVTGTDSAGRGGGGCRYTYGDRRGCDRTQRRPALIPKVACSPES